MDIPPGLTVMKLGVGSIRKAGNDPEHTMQVALTHRETAIIAFGNTILCYLFPELVDPCNEFARKMLEVGIAQEYLPDIYGDNA